MAVLSPALGAIVRDLGLGELVVGRHAWDRGFGDGVPPVGDQTAIDYERLRRAAPTHVLLQWGDRALPARFRELAESEGWAVENIEVLSLGEIGAAVRRVAAFCGDGAARERAEGLVGELDAALAPVEGLRERAGRVVSLYGVNPLGVAGPGSFTFEMVERLGARAAPRGGGGVHRDGAGGSSAA